MLNSYRCYICCEDYGDQRSDHPKYIMNCDDHSYHVDCYYRKCKTWGWDKSQTEGCVVCFEELPIDEAVKLQRVSYRMSNRYKYMLYAKVLDDNPEGIESILSQFVPSSTVYKRLVREALDRGLLRSASCLKNRQSKCLTIQEQKEFVLEMFKSKSALRMCWVFGDFDLDKTGRLVGGDLDLVHLERFVANNANNELYVIVMNDFNKLAPFVLSRACTAIYFALKDQPDELTYCPQSIRDQPHKLFEEFRQTYPDKRGYIYTQLIPFVIQQEEEKQREDTTSIFKRLTLDEKATFILAHHENSRLQYKDVPDESLKVLPCEHGYSDTRGEDSEESCNMIGDDDHCCGNEVTLPPTIMQTDSWQYLLEASGPIVYTAPGSRIYRPKGPIQEQPNMDVYPSSIDWEIIRESHE